MLIFSLAIRIAATALALMLLARLRDWRVGILALLLAVMTVRGGIILEQQLTNPDAAPRTFAGTWPGVTMSFIALLAVIALGRLISEMDRARAALLLSEERFALAVQGSSDGLWDWDLKAGRGWFSERFWELIGRSPDGPPLDNEKFLAMIHPEDQEHVREALLAHFRGEADYGVDFRIMLADGRQRWLHARGRALRDDQGDPVRIAGSVYDITDRRTAIEEAEKSVSLLQATLESTADGILVVDRSMRIISWNEQFRRMWNVPLPVIEAEDDQQAVKHVLDQLIDPGSFQRKITELYERPEASSFDTIEFKDGRVFERYSRPQFIGTEITGRVWSFRDISERVRMEEEKTRMGEQLRQSQKMEAIGQLAGGVAHDFNNLLTVINGNADLLMLQTGGNQALARRVEQILQAGEKAATLTNQLLVFSRRQVLRPDVLDVNAVLAGSVRMLERLIGERIEICAELRHGIPGILADRGQLEAAVMNLVLNSRDAMPRGGRITLKTSVTPASADEPGTVFLEVTDTGTGMDEATRARVFEPFFTTKEPGRGTGLGLAMLYGFMEQSGGTVTVESEPGQGTTFLLSFPACDDPVPESRIGSDGETGAGTETILLAEDDPHVRAYLGEVLEDAGYTVVSAESGSRALDIFRSEPSGYDLLLTDCVMPGISGIELAREVTRSLAIPVLYISGYTDEMISADSGIESLALLRKPFTREELLATVRGVIDRANSRA